MRENENLPHYLMIEVHKCASGVGGKVSKQTFCPMRTIVTACLRSLVERVLLCSVQGACVCVCVGESSLTPPLQRLGRAERSDWPSQSSRSVRHACASPRCFSHSLSLFDLISHRLHAYYFYYI
ncbi:hypothetical protein QQF64_005082 [Cirrhinus molitorella]|uniref:Uncharacterized protein n=1 Tax=Cirrhinus molitorella TaxID=172907 RepID=A0ABR3MI20_9TELE